MISKVHIKNFQSHQDSILEFNPGVNTIVGSSDSGKTAIFRALTWVVTNRPLGASFRSWGSDKTEVTVTVNDLEIARTKSKSENNYIFKDRELLAGTEVPEDIQKALNMNPAINIQTQMAPPFLLSNSPGEVAAFFNDIAGLSDIDKSIKNLKSWQAGHTRSIKQTELDIQKYEKQISSMEYIEEAEQKISHLELERDHLQQLTNDQNKIDNLIHKYIRCYDTMIKLDDKVLIIQPIDALLDQIKELGKLKHKVKVLERIIMEGETGQRALITLDRKSKAIPDLEKVTQKMDGLRKIEVDIQALQSLWKSWCAVNLNMKTKQNQAEEYRIKVMEMMPDECPLCGNEVDHEAYS